MRIVSNLPRVAIRVAPAIHAAQHERAGRARVPSAAGSTAGRPNRRRQASGYSHLTRSRPQGSAPNRGHRYQEPCKLLAGRGA